ncbi:MAG: branched-chain amino acid ABC transporter permease [Chloroflexota bacterium]|nr:branched-chain amino acid ABC transporter permease [Chloroflexota bacterium]MDE3194461.1 branched-chain amino acid ABC transporter permease [Chloroflexota bacterium]
MNEIGFYIITILIYTALNGILVLGLNMQFGITGIFNFAYILLVAVGAYGTGIAALGPATGAAHYIGGFGWAFPWDVAFGMGMTILFALGLSLVAFRRISHWYLALTLSAIAWALLVLATNDLDLVNGEIGLVGIQGPWQDQLDSTTYQFAFLGIALLALAVTYVVFWRVERSPLGRALRAVREDELAAASLGKNPARLKTVGFLLGAAAAGLGGGLSIVYLGGWSTGSWAPGETFILLTAVIVGGRGWAPGAILGSLIVLEGIIEGTTFLPDFGGRTDLLPAVQSMLVGAVLLAVLWWRPRGLWPEPKERFTDTQPGPVRAPVGVKAVPSDDA